MAISIHVLFATRQYKYKVVESTNISTAKVIDKLEKAAQGKAQCEVSAYARSCRRCVATNWKDQTRRAQNCKHLR